MAAERLPLHQRFTGRILLFGLLPTLVVVGAVAAINATRAYRAYLRATREDVATAAKLAAAELDRQNDRVALLAETMAQAQIDGKMFGKRLETLAFLRAILLSHPEVQGAYVGYEPNADGGDAKADATCPKEALGPGGRFLPYWRKDAAKPDGARLEPLVGMEDPEYLYYLEPKRVWESEHARHIVFTKPYDYEGVTMIEQTYPLVLDGRFVGISGVDRSLAQLGSTLRAIADRLGGDCFLSTVSADRVHRFIAATADPSLATRPVAESPFLREMSDVPGASELVRLREGVDPVLGESCYYATIELDNGWRLVLRKSSAGALAEVERIVLLNGLTAAAGCVLIAVGLVLFARGVSKRLQLVVASADRIAGGDLSEPVPAVRVRDETAVLLDSFRAMTDNLNKIVAQVRQASIQLNSISTELAAGSRQQQDTVTEFSASTTQVAAASREMAAAGAELLRTMQEMSESASVTSQQAEEGRHGLSTMHEVMQRLDHEAGSVAARLGTINEKAQSINAIVATIAKVAEQTNLLSVNAAIEAEKAGEFGVGFLVVAREIRRLADQTASATLDIERTVRQMQGAVSTGVGEMDRFGDTLHECLTTVGEVSDRLEGVIRHVEADASNVRRAMESTEAQTAGVKQIDEAMRQLSGGAKQTAQATVEFGKAAGDLQAAIGQLKAAVALVRLRS